MGQLDKFTVDAPAVISRDMISTVREYEDVAEWLKTKVKAYEKDIAESVKAKKLADLKAKAAKLNAEIKSFTDELARFERLGKKMLLDFTEENEAPKVPGIVYQDNWTIDSIDINLLPAEYVVKVADEGVIKAKVKKLGKDAESVIPGLKVKNARIVKVTAA